MSNQTRRSFLGTLGATAAAMPGFARAQGELPQLQKKPGDTKPRNVIFILCDDHRYDFMGFKGKPSFLETPNMDRMASEGAHLANATVSTSLCSPSRASILTGLYAHSHGVVDNNTLVPEGTVFFPQYLRQIGYQTAMMGKWHMGRSVDDPRPGFDKWVSFRGQGVYYNPTFNIDGERVQREGYITDLLTDYAVDWMQNERDQEKPFFLYLSHKAVHAMFEPAKRHLGKYDDVELEYPANMANTPENYEGKPDWVKEQRNSWHGVDYMYHGAMDFDTFYRRYCETLLAVDESIGRVLDYLDDSGLAEDTLVIYMGDNGFVFGEHGLIDKRHMYRESMQVPMLAYAPGLIEPGTVINDMVQNIDIAETVMDAAGYEAPSYMHGRSFLPLLRGETVDWRDAVYYEYYWEWNYPQTPTTHGVLTDQYKYIHYHGIWDSDELYDVQADPAEMNNLIDDPQYRQTVQRLNTMMFDWLESTGGMLIPLRRTVGEHMDQRRPGTE